MQLSDLQILAGRREEGEGRGQWVSVGEVHFVKIQRYTCITMCTILKCVLYVCTYSGTPLFYRGVAYLRGVFVLYLGLSEVAFTEVVSSRQGWPLRGAPLYSVTRIFQGPKFYKLYVQFHNKFHYILVELCRAYQVYIFTFSGGESGSSYHCDIMYV